MITIKETIVSKNAYRIFRRMEDAHVYESSLLWYDSELCDADCDDCEHRYECFTTKLSK